MRAAQLLLLSSFLTGAAWAQSFEAISHLRMNDTTPRTTRAIALGGATDPLGDAAELQHVVERLEVPRIFFNPPPAASQFDRLFRSVDGRAVVANAGLRWRVTPRIALAAAYDGAGSFTRTTSVCNLKQATLPDD